MIKVKAQELPFDQYSRQAIVKDIIDTAIRLDAKNKSLKIIDLGGHKGHTGDFLSSDTVTILDVFDEVYDGYLKGDATKMTFPDDSYDVAVSFDTFEHIPKDLRRAFVAEASRVAKYAAIIAAPFEDNQKNVRHTEIKANDIYKLVTGKDHPWLQEHIEYGLPDQTLIEKYIDELGLQFVKVPTNNLLLWFMTQTLMFTGASFDHDIKDIVDVSQFYNTHLDNVEAAGAPHYRYIYVISSDSRVINAVRKAMLQDTSSTDETQDVKVIIDYLSKISEAYVGMVKNLQKDVAYLQERESHLQGAHDHAAVHAKELEHNIEAIHKSPSWRITHPVQTVRKKGRKS